MADRGPRPPARRLRNRLKPGEGLWHIGGQGGDSRRWKPAPGSVSVIQMKQLPQGRDAFLAACDIPGAGAPAHRQDPRAGFRLVLHQRIGGACHAVGQRDRGLLGLLAVYDLPQPVFASLAPSARANLRYRAEIEQPAQIPVGSPALSDGSRSRAHSWRCVPAAPCRLSSVVLASGPARRTDPCLT